MTTDVLTMIFADFNEPAPGPAEPAVEEVASAVDEINDIRQEAWTDGYLRGRLETTAHAGDQALAARLLTSVHELEAKASEAVEAASLAVADMLVNAFIAVASDDWSAKLPDRVRMVAERIKPAMGVAPEFVLRDEHGTMRHFGDLTELSRALESGGAVEDVTIQWQRGEATISRTALIENLRDAVLPLTASLNIQQSAGNQS